MPIRKLLVANRGEIAARILRTAKRLGLATVAVYSEADAQAYHLGLADERAAIGPPPAKDSYLNMDAILAAARAHGADAIHPGYGFLSENAAFAAKCRRAGLNFVGPPTEAIAQMGSKTAARAVAAAADVPLLPGTELLRDVDTARRQAAAMGYPVLLKPAAGGGGIGMGLCQNEAALDKHFAACQTQAQRFFGDGGVYLEKYLEGARHVEIQVAADMHGNQVHLGERDCSIQRRHQKVLEETPSPAVHDALRQRMAAAALRLCRKVGYASLGTVEMLVQGDAFYFLEMNTRLQVEHTVTEMVTGLDLVEWQIHIAMGESLPARQEELHFSGHAVQCRIYAENPDKKFFPSPGVLTRFEVPVMPNVRVDAGVVAGERITPFYDPMLAKLIVHGANRAEAVSCLKQALDHFHVEGVATNLGMHRRIADDAAFIEGQVTTRYLRERLGYQA